MTSAKKHAQRSRKTYTKPTFTSSVKYKGKDTKKQGWLARLMESYRKNKEAKK